MREVGVGAASAPDPLHAINAAAVSARNRIDRAETRCIAAELLDLASENPGLERRRLYFALIGRLPARGTPRVGEASPLPRIARAGTLDLRTAKELLER